MTSPRCVVIVGTLVAGLAAAARKIGARSFFPDFPV